MKPKLIIPIILAVSTVLAGCSSVGANLAKFVDHLPPNTLTDATQSTNTPIYSHTESVTGMSKAPDGTIIISNLKASATIPEIGVTWGISVSGLTISPPAVKAADAVVPKPQ